VGASLRLLLQLWLRWQHPVASAELRLDETLSHFLFHRRTDFSVTNGRVRLKAAALIPFKYVELSTYRIEGLPDSLVWLTGRIFVGTWRSNELFGKQPLARANLTPQLVNNESLRATVKEPPVRHVDIVGWPAEKHLQILTAQNLIKNGATVELSPAGLED